jgi:hypothetical protein
VSALPGELGQLDGLTNGGLVEETIREPIREFFPQHARHPAARLGLESSTPSLSIEVGGPPNNEVRTGRLIER